MAPPICGRCSQVLSGSYYLAGDAALCAPCGETLRSGGPAPFDRGLFLRALALGAVGLALGVGISWAIAANVDWHPGINALIATLLVGAGIRFGSRGRGGRPLQLLAVVLGYVAAAASIVPVIARHEGALTLGRAFYPFWAIPAAPFQGGRAGTQGLVFVLIIALGLFRSWRLNRAARVELDGPRPVPPLNPPPGAGV